MNEGKHNIPFSLRIYDYGEFLLTPSVSPLKSQWPDKASKYNRTSAVMKPYMLNTTWQSYCTGPERSVMMRFARQLGVRYPSNTLRDGPSQGGRPAEHFGDVRYHFHNVRGLSEKVRPVGRKPRL